MTHSIIGYFTGLSNNPSHDFEKLIEQLMFYPFEEIHREVSLMYFQKVIHKKPELPFLSDQFLSLVKKYYEADSESPYRKHLMRVIHICMNDYDPNQPNKPFSINKFIAQADNHHDQELVNYLKEQNSATYSEEEIEYHKKALQKDDVDPLNMDALDYLDYLAGFDLKSSETQTETSKKRQSQVNDSSFFPVLKRQRTENYFSYNFDLGPVYQFDKG